jgi:hypothetical protein
MVFQLRNINHSTDRLIVAHYAMGNGGKFLLNCLALSRHMVLQDSVLAREQLGGRLVPDQKLDILLTRLSQVTDTWRDLDLGCVQLFGDDEFKDPKVPGFELRHCRFGPVVHELTHGSLCFACVTHDVFQLSHTLSRWPGARIINLTNAGRFRQRFRPPAASTKWQQLRGPDWPQDPPANLDQYQAMPENIQREIQDLALHDYYVTPLLWAQDQDWLSHQEHLYFCEAIKHRQCWQWDLDWYLDRDQMLQHLAELYHWLHFDDFDHSKIIRLYDAYVMALERIKHHNNQS